MHLTYRCICDILYLVIYMNKFFDKISVTRYAAIPQNVPQEGIFWIKDGEFVAYTWQVTVGYEDQDCFNRNNVTYLDHRNVWKDTRNETVSFDYYPRGRVTVEPLFDENGKFIYKYSYCIYIDNCCNNGYTIGLIDREFNLSDCTCLYIGPCGAENYTCHSCRDGFDEAYEKSKSDAITLRDLTDKEAEIYDEWLNSQAVKTGERLF